MTEDPASYTVDGKEVKLIPCPYCDGTAVFDKPARGWGMWARCTNCPAEMFGIDEIDVVNISLQKAAVAKSWNTRAK